MGFTLKGKVRKMEKNLEISKLLDFYAPMLTEKQRDAVELYYNEDLSLSEISDHQKITRQGVRDSIKRGESILLELEEKLGFSKRFDILQENINKLNELAQDIYDINYRHKFSSQIDSDLRDMHKVLENISQDLAERID
jgi:predicted DNA-binding protein YlxM (UPF0122 family)